jgi:hypothetical protein
MKPKRKSQTLAWLKAELRAEALKLPEGEERDRLWRWYYRAQTAEFEVNALVLEAEIRTLLQYAVEYGLIKADAVNNLFADDEPPQTPKPKKSRRKKSAANVDDNLPKQKKLWD